MSNDGIRAARVTSPRSAAANPKERPRTRREATAIVAPTSWSASPACTHPAGCTPEVRAKTPAKVHQKQGANRRHAGSRSQRVAGQDRRSPRSFVERRRPLQAVGAIERYRSGRSAEKYAAPPAPTRLAAILMACAARGGGEAVSNQWASPKPAPLLGWDVTARLLGFARSAGPLLRLCRAHCLKHSLWGSVTTASL